MRRILATILIFLMISTVVPSICTTKNVEFAVEIQPNPVYEGSSVTITAYCDEVERIRNPIAKLYVVTSDGREYAFGQEDFDGKKVTFVVEIKQSWWKDNPYPNHSAFDYEGEYSARVRIFEDWGYGDLCGESTKRFRVILLDVDDDMWDVYYDPMPYNPLIPNVPLAILGLGLIFFFLRKRKYRESLRFLLERNLMASRRLRSRWRALFSKDKRELEGASKDLFLLVRTSLTALGLLLIPLGFLIHQRQVTVGGILFSIVGITTFTWQKLQGPEPEVIYCPSCGARMNTSSPFCGKCGKKLRKMAS